MCQWHRNIQRMIDEIDACIRREDDETSTLSRLAGKLGYSESYVSRKFRELSGMRLREYLCGRRLAFALRDLRCGGNGILDIALKYGYSSSEAFAHAFKAAYGLSPSAYRLNPVPVALRTVLRPLDCYLVGAEKTDAAEMDGGVKTYFITLPAHKFLHIRNYESIGYWDFWQKQSLIPGQDHETICRLLSRIPDKLDDLGRTEADSGSGQVIGFINEPEGRICSWGIPLAEAYGVRLPAGYTGPVPPQMQLMDVAEGTYVVFEHGPFDFETQNALVEEKIERAMKAFQDARMGYRLDLTPGRVFYFYHDCKRFWKYVRPVREETTTSPTNDEAAYACCFATTHQGLDRLLQQGRQTVEKPTLWEKAAFLAPCRHSQYLQKMPRHKALGRSPQPRQARREAPARWAVGPKAQSDPQVDRDD